MIRSFKFGIILAFLWFQYLLNNYECFQYIFWLIIMDILVLVIVNYLTLNSTQHTITFNGYSFSKLFVLFAFIFFLFGVDLYKSFLPSLLLTCYSFLHIYPSHILFCVISSGFYILDWNESNLLFPYPSYQGMLVGSLFNTAIVIFMGKQNN